MSEQTMEKFARGRFSLSAKVVRKMGLKDGDGFVAESDGEKKVLFTKINLQEALDKQ